MLNVNEVNAIVGALMMTVEERVPQMAPLALGNLEGFAAVGTHGSVILGALFTGDLDGKLTLCLEWETAFQLAEGLTRTKVDSFSDLAQASLEELFREMAGRIAGSFADAGRGLEIYPLPTLVDTSVLLSEDGESGALRLPISGHGGSMSLYLAFK